MSPGTVSFRDVAPDEVAAVKPLATRIWWDCYRGMIPDAQISRMLDWMYDPARVADELRAGVRWEWLLLDGAPVGYLSWELQHGALHLHKLYLEKAWHGRGLGQRMLAHVEERARAAKASHVDLRVNRANDRALRAYRRAGYQRIADDVRDIGDGFVMDDHILRRDVREGRGGNGSGGEGGIRTPGSD